MFIPPGGGIRVFLPIASKDLPSKAVGSFTLELCHPFSPTQCFIKNVLCPYEQHILGVGRAFRGKKTAMQSRIASPSEEKSSGKSPVD